MTPPAKPLESRRWYPLMVALLSAGLGVAIGQWTESFPLRTDPDAISQPIWSWIAGATGWILGYFLGGQQISWRRLLLAGAVAVCFAVIVPFTLFRPPAVLPDSYPPGSDPVRDALNDQEMLIAWGSSSLFFFISYPEVFKNLGRTLGRRGYDDDEEE